MYIRKALKSNKNSAKIYKSHQLVETIRTEKGVQQKLLLSLGRLSLSKDKWSRLAKRIESIIQNQTALINEDPEIEALAQKYALEFINKHATDIGITDYQTVSIKSLQNHRVRQVGA